VNRYDQLCDTLVNQPRRWLVTGVGGFIGSALLERLLDLGQSVVGVDSFITGHRSNIEDVLAITPDSRLQFKMIEGDLRDPEVAKAACADVDYVLHQAALGSVPRSIKDPIATHQHNVDAFLNVLVAAKDAGVKRVVYASSSSVYGDHPGLPKHEDRIGTPLSPYAVTKRADELYAQVFHDTYQQEVVGLRYFNVFGRRQDPDGPYASWNVWA
jgi:UDP-N-acetylglucosamine 4-epimerase